ncbi:MAG: BREX system P-loop protein BrxC [Methanobrevibacter sp.]|uniref:BREX system P-loop protein BrxC n=1 Tax=Methanobrevibacter sp. TaxID=66852 RepID=UPI0025F4C4F1|nr:BREX system P-loop protein BrxC [Methanobrevibacter sp.]MBR3112546.1 BREX system P-loop protein BrxC [Methanobrevibacter sp.]
MQIKDMFEKDISRDIKGVIKVGQNDEDNIYQELDEYVVTNELLKHFNKFFSNYSNGIQNPNEDIGVWISGFFGSGKSHFLKILSYILDSGLEVKGRKPIDFFKEDGKIENSMIIGDMETATNVSSDVILFNIDSKASSQSNSKKEPILNVFVNVFNEMRGYSPDKPFLADFEKKLDEENKLNEFKREFESISGKSWDNEGRSEFKFVRRFIIQAIVNIGFMDEDDAKYWANNAENNYELRIEDFANEVKQYCIDKGNNHHVIFLVDEVGQYIADDTKLMLNLQTIVEELGIKCKGKAWVIVTSQQNIDDITRDIKGMDFSKIQGRFKTRLSLSSSNVDEVIRRRILKKTDVAQQTLEAEYSNIDSILKNIFTFEKSAEMKTYENAEDFANIYPFVPYQFNRVQDVLTSIREHSASGKHMADGERSMLALFQESAIEVKDDEEGTLVPFNIFYNAIEQFIDHTHSQVINKARDNSYLFDFDVEILKVLFMIKYVKEIKATSKNITTLMISNINEDRLELNSKVDKSLKRLLEQTLIQKNGEVYSFLTNEEQDINREIKNQIVDPGEVLTNAANRIFAEIYPKKKYKFSNRYNFQFNQSIDNQKINNKEFDIGMRIITPYYESNLNDSGQSTFEGGNMHNILKGLSEANNEVVVHLLSDLTVFDEIREALQIQKFLTKKSAEIKPELRARKQEEYNDKIERIKLFLESSIKDATIYVKGDKVDIAEKNVEARLDEAMGKLVDKVYNKLSYMDFAPDKSDVKDAIGEEHQATFASSESKCINAVNDMDNYIQYQSKMHNPITLKSLLQRYSKAPYGFINLDIQWIVATLFAQKRIVLTMNSNEISLKEVGTQKILDYLTKTEYFEKLLVAEKPDIDDDKTKIVKDILQDVYESTVKLDNDEMLMEEFKRLNKLKLNVVDECLLEFKVSDKYPGKQILNEAQELFHEVNNKKNMLQFFNFVSDREKDFLKLPEELDPVLAFFQGSQKGIFSNACDVYEVYESNKNLINDSKLSETASKIDKIINMPNPYSCIRKLPELNNKFNLRFDEILEDKRNIILNGINNDFDSVISRLTDDELKNKFENNVILRFDSLKNKLISEKNIAVINGITTESENLKSNFINEIDIFITERNGGDKGDGDNSPIEVDIDIQNITKSTKVKLESEAQIDDLLNQIKEKLKKELKNADIINLKL